MTHNGEGAAFSRQVSLPITSPVVFILLEIYYDTNPIKFLLVKEEEEEEENLAKGRE
jgi:hypothetical protein